MKQKIVGTRRLQALGGHGTYVNVPINFCRENDLHQGDVLVLRDAGPGRLLVEVQEAQT